MGQAKLVPGGEDTKRILAISIAVSANTLQRCDLHDSQVFIGKKNVDTACRLGEFRYDSRNYGEVFGSKEKMRAAIKEVVSEITARTCPVCTRSQAPTKH